PIDDPIDLLATGPAVQSGLMTLTPDDIPLAERVLAIPQHLIWALRGLPATVPGATLGIGPRAPRLSPSILDQARRHGQALMSRPCASLAIRSGSPAERSATANAVCEALGKRPLFLSK